MINCEINLILAWPENCVLTDITIPAAVLTQIHNPARPAVNAPAVGTFKLTDTKLYVPWSL